MQLGVPLDRGFVHISRHLLAPLEGRWCGGGAQVRVSYQKLLKMYVLNVLHHRSPKNLKKKSLFKVLPPPPPPLPGP